MYKICLGHVKNNNDYEELIRMFLPADSYKIVDASVWAHIKIPAELIKPDEKKDKIKKYLYEKLNNMTGKVLIWGTLTGVKPLKLYDKILDSEKSENKAAESSLENVKKIIENDYLVDHKKITLLEEIHKVQNETVNFSKQNLVSIYIGIPFCPTRCSYCSFTSNQKDYSEITRYLDTLCKEIDYVSGLMQNQNIKAETIYIGGGTPTTLNVKELKQLINTVSEKIPTIHDFEFTVEAGRPDTINEEKLQMMYEAGVNRISINPQTMNDNSLKLIGRDHDANDIKTAFHMADKIKFNAINADLIAGLPGETLNDFKKTLDEVLELNPKNITVHTLALKKSSKLMTLLLDAGKVPEADTDKTAENMVDYAFAFLKENGYRPYYIYRQKYMADNLENVGYAKKGTECIYNIRIMEEKQTVIAMGAGGSSKVFYPKENRLERIVNVSNYEIYIDRIDEMIDRKRKILDF